jgi:DNA sulfur modification protein DndD
MLRLNKISLKDFGPFKGEQSINFTKEPGVSVVYGENMRGKTYLLNAIRYAFFGKVLSRGSRQLPVHEIGNWESAAVGNYGFQVDLFFNSESQDYQLTRITRPRPGLTKPEGDGDYVQEVYLARGGNVLGPAEMQNELARVMPEQVSRFFLFDGELLQEYEELLRDESEMGRRITESIERILGVPVLTNARAHLRGLENGAQQSESKAAQKDQKTQKLGTLLSSLTENRTHNENEVERYKSDLSELKERKVQLEVAMKKTEKIRGYLDERDRIEKNIKDIEKRRTEKGERLKEIASDAWKGMLKDKITEMLSNFDAEIDELQHNITENAVRKDLTQRIQESLTEGRCTICERTLDKNAENRLKEILGQSYATNDEDKQVRLAELHQFASTLRKLDFQDQTKLIRELERDISELLVEKIHAEDRIKEIGEQTANYDQSEIRETHFEYEKTIKEIAIVEQGLRNQDEKLKEIYRGIKDVQDELDRKGGADVARERDRRDFFHELYRLFDEGVGVFREKLRRKVESDASNLFLQLTSEPDYKGLQINDSFGLTIVHKDGSAVPVRSAGAEHIVALSLMGALQRNAPLRGPIIMDSPFGRLDNAHTTKVVRALPTMAEQVMLLVYETELKPQFARNELKGALRDEYRMLRASAKHTILEKFVEEK